MAKATMRAVRFERANRQLTVQDVPVPQPRPGEVLVRVEAAGICASDLHMIDGTMPDFSLRGETNCGICRHCVGGSGVCLNLLVMGQNYDGGWAEYILVPFGALAALPDRIPFAQAALISDAVATPYTGLIHRGGRQTITDKDSRFLR